MGEKRRFPIPMQTLCAISQFPFEMSNTNNQLSNETFLLMSFSKTSKALKNSTILIFKVLQIEAKTKNLKENKKFTFQEGL
jgi:hypothetical protein